ncbi:hypothetical protein NQ314_015731 [Rhamnusium bicolor]|uniref:Peptidase A2 domain-containing protein n=1 Tax=Rhamnusium bicolor TaxID=1586634 RepID=A0AAV8WXQ8_9CUCU|nr:hypothetical protein NQ314_015731 [Rhamnusium bicolor]
MAQGGSQQQQTLYITSSNIGKVPEYNSTEDFSLYLERLEQYFIANFIDEDRKVAVLLTVIGSHTYRILRDLCDPVLPKNKSFDELCERELNSTKLGRMQPSPSMKWYARIKNLAIPCSFGNLLEEILKDKFITGLKKGKILDRLCEEEATKKVQELLEIAVKKEASAKEQTEEIHKIKEDKQNGCENLDSISMFSLNTEDRVKAIEIEVLLNGINVKMELDTGAGVSVISSTLFRKWFSTIKLEKTDIEVRTYNGNVLRPLGVINVNMTYNNQSKVIKLLVIESDCQKPLFGRDLMKVFNLSFECNMNKMDVERDECVDIILEEFKDVFANKLGKYAFEKIELKLKDDVSGIFKKPVPIPYAVAETSYLERMNQFLQGTIEIRIKKGWKKAVIEEVLGERTYFVRVVDEDVVWKRHTDQLIKEGDFYERCIKIESEKEIDGNDLITSAETVVDFSKDQNEIINSEVESKLARDVKEQGNLGNGNLENNIDSSQIVSNEESIVAKENVFARSRN